MLYSQFLEQRATIVRDLYQLLRKDVAWTCKEKLQQAYEGLKQLLSQRTVPALYNPNKPLVIS